MSSLIDWQQRLYWRIPSVDQSPTNECTLWLPISACLKKKCVCAPTTKKLLPKYKTKRKTTSQNVIIIHSMHMGTHADAFRLLEQGSVRMWRPYWGRVKCGGGVTEVEDSWCLWCPLFGATQTRWWAWFNRGVTVILSQSLYLTKSC